MGRRFTAQGGNIPPFFININKRQGQAIEDRIKELQYWLHTDKNRLEMQWQCGRRRMLFCLTPHEDPVKSVVFHTKMVMMVVCFKVEMIKVTAER